MIVRKLQDFESPYVSLARAEKGQIVQMRKAYWDPRVDAELHKDPIALNLLYIETINEIKKGSIEVEDDAADDLANFRSQKDRLAFLGLASTLKGYGDQSFGSAYTNYPKPNTMASRKEKDRIKPHDCFLDWFVFRDSAAYLPSAQYCTCEPHLC